MNNMIKLVKYDIIKTKTVLLAVFMGLFVTEAAFIIGMITKLNLMIGVSSVILVLALTTSLIALVIYAIHIYNTDFSKKQGYMPFLTPTSPYAIIASKLITTLLVAFVATIIAICFFSIDMYLVTKDVKPELSLGYAIKVVLDSFDGKWGSVILCLINIVLEFLNNIIVIYLAITLTNSLLGESKLRGITAFGMWVAINVIMMLIAKVLSLATKSSIFSGSLNTSAGSVEDLVNLSFNNKLIILGIISNLVISVIIYSVTGWIADKKMSM
ncbi:MAG: hypothetical protein Q4F95_14975 [Oscillospiraceae bacterium]|nr:hypothetical protein [Oscillospiraceae bacterium]